MIAPEILFWKRNLYLYENSNNMCNRVGGSAAWLLVDA